MCILLLQCLLPAVDEYTLSRSEQQILKYKKEFEKLTDASYISEDMKNDLKDLMNVRAAMIV